MISHILSNDRFMDYIIGFRDFLFEASRRGIHQGDTEREASVLQPVLLPRLLQS